MSKEFDSLKFNENYEKTKKQKNLKRRLKDAEKLKKLNKKLTNKKLHNMSILDILIEFKDSIFNILDDLINFNFKDFNTFLKIFSKNNRLFYLGLLIIFTTSIIYIFTEYDTNNYDNNIKNTYNTYNTYNKPLNNSYLLPQNKNLNNVLKSSIPKNINEVTNIEQEPTIDTDIISPNDIILAEMNE
jgi:hypothetical protein